MTHTTRAGAGVLFGGALVALLTACSFSWTSRGSGSSSAWSGSSSAGTAGGPATVSIASCSGGSCSVTLGGAGAQVQVLGTSISFGGIRDGRATVRIRGRDVSLTQGQTVSVDRLVLRCTSVTRDTVTMVGSLE